MKDDRDAGLQELFSRENEELDGEIFIDRVMAQTRSRRSLLAMALAGLVLVFAMFAWTFSIPLMELAQMVSQVLTITVVNLGDSWVAWLLSPINNVASALVLSVKTMRVLRKKIIRASYIN